MLCSSSSFWLLTSIQGGVKFNVSEAWRGQTAVLLLLYGTIPPWGEEYLWYFTYIAKIDGKRKTGV